MKILKERDYTEAEWQDMLSQAKTQDNMQVLRPHFNSGDYIAVVSMGWRLEAVTRPTWQYASTKRPQDIIAVLEDGDIELNVGYDEAYQIEALREGLKYIYTTDAIKSVMKLAQKYGDSPLERDAKAALKAKKSVSIFA